MGYKTPAKHDSITFFYLRFNSYICNTLKNKFMSINPVQLNLRIANGIMKFGILLMLSAFVLMILERTVLYEEKAALLKVTGKNQVFLEQAVQEVNYIYVQDEKISVSLTTYKSIEIGDSIPTIIRRGTITKRGRQIFIEF